MSERAIYVVIPALDEEASLPRVLADLSKLDVPPREVVVVDNGSRDRTGAVARAGGATVLEEPERGYGAACQRALRHLGDLPPDAIVVFLDADYSDHPEELPQLVAPILAGRADFVIGSRLARPGARASVPFPSRVGNALASAYLDATYGVRFTDLGPFRAIRWSSLAALGMRDRSWGWTLEMQLRACEARLRILEIPVRYRIRLAGRSKISGSLRGAARAAARILWVMLRHGIARRLDVRWGPI